MSLKKNLIKNKYNIIICLAGKQFCFKIFIFEIHHVIFIA